MKMTETIWESASRPLFVRSVWLEMPNVGRGQRHFILDYEPQQKQKRLKSAASPLRRNRESLKHSLSYDITELESQLYDIEVTNADDLFLLGSGKVKLHQPISQQQYRVQQKTDRSACKRACFASKRIHNIECYQRRPFRGERPEPHSRRSSLQDMHSMLSNTCSTADERLAERVLNWLDLAGKSAIVRVDDEESDMKKCAETVAGHSRAKTGMGSSNAKQRKFKSNSLTQNQRNLSPAKCFNRVRDNNSNIAPHTPTHCHYKPESAKPITIIFNKEGIPVRFNRSARNIDLCALTASASTTRRLAGPLASARLYNNTAGENNNSASNRLGSCTLRKDFTEANKSQFATQRFMLEPTVSALNDAKRQLHIFMPSLPKKGVILSETLSNTGLADDCMTNSVLSSNFSEFCNI